MGITYEKLKTQAQLLPEVEASTSYGTPALKVRGKLMVRLKEDSASVVIRAAWEDRERLMVMHPKIFFVTDHYRKYPWVLAHLKTLTRAIAQPVLLQAWHLCAPSALVKKHLDTLGE